MVNETLPTDPDKEEMKKQIDDLEHVVEDIKADVKRFQTISAFFTWCKDFLKANGWHIATIIMAAAAAGGSWRDMLKSIIAYLGGGQ